VRSLHRGMRRRVGVAQCPEDRADRRGLRQAIGAIEAESLAGIRDRALLLVGFAGALRRSELAALGLSDLRFEADGTVVRLRRSKGDQEGAGVEVSIPLGIDEATCPRGFLRSAGSSARRFSRGASSGGSIGATTSGWCCWRRR
jgi:integrase